MMTLFFYSNFVHLFGNKINILINTKVNVASRVVIYMLHDSTCAINAEWKSALGIGRACFIEH